MDLLDLFKNYLLSGRKPLSKVSVKNYLSDIRHFIAWFEKAFDKSFSPQEISGEIMEIYKKNSLDVNIPGSLSQSSLERHIASLRKFFEYLLQNGYTQVNPLTQAIVEEKKDSWRIKEFKNSLFIQNASHHTIKNYIKDIEDFREWHDQITDSSENFDLDLVNQYKERLLHSLNFSPKSINRKLSSIRKYMKFLGEEGELAHNLPLNEAPEDIETTNLEELSKEEFEEQPSLSLYDKFEIAAANQVIKLIKSAKQKINPIKIKNSVSNIKKEFYAPEKISTKNFPFHKKIYHHARHTRPEWYKKYHNLAFSHYLHISLLIIYSSIVGYVIYQSLFLDSKNSFAAPYQPLRVYSFQGKLTDSSDNPITEAKQVRFTLYDSLTASGTAKLWEEVRTISPDDEGIFSTLLASKSTGTNADVCTTFPAAGVCGLPESLFRDHMQVFLGIAIGNDSELAPRQQVATVAYSTNSQFLQGLPPITQSGAGTTNVVLALDSSGNLTIGDSANPVFQATGGQFKLTGETVLITSNESSDGNIILAPDGIGKIDLQSQIINSSASGSLSPGAVEINDKFAILATESAVAAFLVNNNTTGGDIFSASSSGTTRFTIANDGTTTINGGANLGDASDDDVAINGRITTSLIPKLTANVDLGTAALNWNNLWVQTLNVTGTTGLTLSGTGSNITFANGETIDNDTDNQINIGFGAADGTLNLTNGANLTSDQTTVNLFNSTATTLNVGGAATAVNIGTASGTTTVGDLAVNGETSADITSTTTTASLFNSNVTTLNIGGEATTIGIGASTGTTTINGNLALGDTVGDTITFAGVVNSNIIPSATNSYDLGSASKLWANGYFTNINATNISGTVTGGSTTAPTWLINSDNATANAEIAALAFSVGTNPINSVLQWNASGDTVSKIAGFDDTNLFNYPLAIFSQVSGGNQTFTSGSLFKYSQPVAHAITQSAAFVGTDIDFSSNITVPDSANGNQTGTKVTLKDGGTSATSVGFQTAGTLDYGLDLGGTIGTADIRLSNAETIDNLVNGTILLTAATTQTSGNLTVGTSETISPLATLDVRGNSGTTPAASISGQTSLAALVVDNSGVGDIFTASSSGLNRFVITQNGNVGIGTTIPAEELTLASTYSLGWDNGSGTVDVALSRGATNRLDLASGDSLNIVNGNITLPTSGSKAGLNTTNDYLSWLGATGNLNASGSFGINIDSNNNSTVATFFVTKDAVDGGGTNLATISEAGQLALPLTDSTAGLLIGGDANLYRSAADTLKTDDSLIVGGTASVSGELKLYGTPTIQSTANQTLTLGGDTTGDIVFQPLNGTGYVGIGTANPSANLHIGSSITAATSGTHRSFIVGPTITGTVDPATTTFDAAQIAWTQNMTGGSNTITDGVGLRIANPSITFGAISNNYGLRVDAQTAGIGDYGVRIDAADTATLWLSGNTNSTSENGGIQFGSSRDTNLYRSAASTLKTDDSFTVGTALSVSQNGHFDTADGGYSLDFGSAADIGLWRSATRTLRIGDPTSSKVAAEFVAPSSGSGNYLRFTGTVAGATPSISALGGDSNIDINFTPKGTGNTIFTAGNVGIGTTTPTALLDVNGTASISGALKLYGTPTIQSTANQTLTLGGDTTGHIVLNGDGSNYVGVGTVNPTTALHVRTGDISVNYDDGGTDRGINLTASLGNNSGIVTTPNNTTNLEFRTSTSTRMFINASDGNVGIGSSFSPTVLPTALLDVSGTASISGALKLYGTPTIQSTARQTLTLGGDTTGDIAFSPGGTTNALFLKTGGNIGINTATPQDKLQVNVGTDQNWGIRADTDASLEAINDGRTAFVAGRINANPLIINANSGGNVFINDTANTLSTIGLTINQGTNDNEILTLKSSDVAHGLTAMSEADSFGRLSKSDSAAGGLNISGLSETNVGLNLRGFVTTTDSTKSTAGLAAIVLEAGGNNAALAADSNLVAIANYGSRVWIADAEGDTWQNGSASISGALKLYGTPTIQSTAKQTLTLGGDTTGDISFAPGNSTNALFLKTGGNVGIGTTNPSAKLDVVGTGEFNVSGGSDAIDLTGTSVGTVSIRIQPSGATSNAARVQGVLNGTNTDLAFLTAGTEQVRINSSGNVGINTTTPTAKLDVNGTASISGALKLYGTPTIQSAANQTLTLGGDTTGDISFAPGNSSRSLLLASSGNVGLGAGSSFYNTTVGTSNGFRIDESTTNLATNPSFETNTTNWGASSGSGNDSIARDTTHVLFGSQALKVTWTDASANRGTAMTDSSAYLQNGTQYTISAWVWIPTGVSLNFRVKDSVFAILGNVLVVGNSAWQRVTTTVTGTANTQTLSRIYFETTTTTIDSFWVDGVQVEAKAYATTYADGSMGPGYAWTGTAHASTSTRTAGGFIADGNITSLTGNLGMAGTGNNYFAGNVGIGTTAPTYALDVSAATDPIARFKTTGATNNELFLDNSDATAVSNIQFLINGTEKWILSARGSGESNRMAIYDGTSEKISILQGGNVGIGATDPSKNLQVRTAAAVGNGYYNGTVLVGDSTVGSILEHWQIGSGRTLIGNLNDTGGAANLIQFGFGTPASGVLPTTAMTINQSGNVGVGTTTPTAKLDVNGTASVSGALKLYGTPTIQSTANQTLTLGGDTTGDILFKPGNSSSGLLLASSGNVGIGTTSPKGILHVASSSTTDDLILNQAATANFVTNPSFEVNTTGWSAVATATITRITTDSKVGTASMKVDVPANADGTSISGTGNATQSVTYSFSAYIKPASASDIGKTVTLFVINNGGTFEFLGSTDTVLTADWQRVTVTGTWANASHTGWTMTARTQAGGTPFSFLIDGVQYEQASAATPYADGSFGPGYYWNGAPNNSSSTRTVGAAFAYQTLNSAGGLGASSRSHFPTLQIDQNGTGDIFVASASGTNKFVITNSGNVGIGTTAPGGTLSVVSAGTTGTTTSSAFNLSANSVTSGTAAYISATGLLNGKVLDLVGTYQPSNGAGGTGINSTFTNSPTVTANSINGNFLSLIDSTALGNDVRGFTSQITLSGNAAKTARAFMTSLSTSSTTADTLYGIDLSGSITGAISTGTRNIYGINSGFTHTAANTGGATNFYGIKSAPFLQSAEGGTTNVFGLHTSTSASHGTDAGTVNNYGLYVANGTSTTNGTSSKYGLFIEAPTGADNNFGAQIGGQIAIGGTANAAYGTYITNDFSYGAGEIHGFRVGDMALTQTSAGGNSAQIASFGIGSSITINSGVAHGLVSNAYFSMPSITETGVGSSVTTAANVFIEGAPTAGDSNYALFVDTGATRLDGSVEIGAPTTANTTALCWDNSGNSLIYDCDGSATDLAELYGTSDTSIEAADIVVATDEAVVIPGPNGGGQTTRAFITKANQPYQSSVLGVISTNPNQVYGEDGVFEESDNPRPVSLAGRVPVKVSTENGPIKTGDAITSSSTPGVGMRATKAGPIIGRALSSYNEAGIGKVTIFVNTSWHDPDIYITNTGDLSIQPLASEIELKYQVSDSLNQAITRMGSFAELVVGNIRAGIINASEVTTGALNISTDRFTIAGQDFRDYIAGIVEQTINQSSIINNQSVIVSPLASIDEVKTNILSPLASDTITAKGNIDVEGQLTSDNLQVTNDASISGNLSSETIQTNTLSTIDVHTTDLTSENASISGTLRAGRIIADDIQGLSDLVATIAARTAASSVSGMEYPVSSSSAETDILATNTLNTEYSILNTDFLDISTMSAGFGTFRDGLIALGPSTFGQLTAIDSISVGTNLTISSNSINMLGEDLQIQPLAQGGVSFLGGKIRIDTEGNLRVGENAEFVKDVKINGTLFTSILSPLPERDLVINLTSNSEFKIQNSEQKEVLSIDQAGNITASGSATISKLNLSLIAPAYAINSNTSVATGSAGTAILKANRREITVENPLVTENSLIYITPVGTSSNQVLSLLRQLPESEVSTGSFTVGTSTPALQDIQFNFLIVN